jgi:hypothetical protein
MAQKGLAALKAQQRKNAEREEARNRPRANWLSTGVINKVYDGAVTGKFMQELDEDSPGFNPDRGVALFEVEHQGPGPEGYKRRGVCTGDPDDGGQCYACQRHQVDPKAGWHQRQNFYINFLADDGTVYVISRNFNSTFVSALIQETEDEGSITDANYRITVSGSGTQTQWLPKRLKSEPIDDSDAEAFDLEETALRRVAYDDQARFYGSVVDSDNSADSSTDPDVDW